MKRKVTIIGEDFGFYYIEDYTEYAEDLKKCESFTDEQVDEYFKEGVFTPEEVNSTNGSHFLYGFLESLYQSDGKCPDMLYYYEGELKYKVEKVG